MMPVEIEIEDQVAELGSGLADVGPWVPTSVGTRVEARAAKEIVLDELQVRIGRQDLVIDVAVPGERADYHRGHAEAVALVVDVRGSRVVVEAAPVVPAEEDRA